MKFTPEARREQQRQTTEFCIRTEQLVVADNELQDTEVAWTDGGVRHTGVFLHGSFRTRDDNFKPKAMHDGLHAVVDVDGTEREVPFVWLENKTIVEKVRKTAGQTPLPDHPLVRETVEWKAGDATIVGIVQAVAELDGQVRLFVNDDLGIEWFGVPAEKVTVVQTAA